MIIQEPVQAAIWHCLNFYDFKDAIFLSERLCCEVETDETIFLLATSYYRSNLIHQAYWLLKDKARRSPHCRFLQAKCAYHLKKYAESECVLVNGGFGDIKNLEDIAKDFGEIACFVLQLIAQICAKTERNKIAADALRRALKLNPFMWQTFSDLCHMGEYVDPAATFQITNTDVFNTCQGNASSNSLVLYGNGAQNISLNDSHYLSSLGNSNQNLDIVMNSINNSSNNVLCTPVEQQLQSQQQPSNVTSQSFITPINNGNNLNNSMSVLRGVITTGSNLQNSGLMMLEDTPLSTIGNSLDQTGLNTVQNVGSGVCSPFRRQIKFLSANSLTPSFGVLPLYSPSGGDSSFVGTGHTQANISVLNTPSPQTLMEANQEPPIIRKKIKSHVGNLITRKESGSASNKPAVFTQTGNVTPRTPNNQGGVSSASLIPNAAVRRSSRLFSNSAYSVKENNKSPNITSNEFALPRCPARKTKTRMPKICLNNELVEDKSVNINADKINEKNARKEKEKIETITSETCQNRSIEDTKVLLNNSLNNAQTMAHHVLTLKKQSADGLMALLRDLGEGYKLLTLYQCKAAIKHFENNIPKHHLCSSWVQSVIGLAYYELREYESAVSVFKDIHEAEQYRLDYMEIYSSSLWHLQKEVDLSALAQDLINQDKTSPVTWCVAGNCFSLHKEHETAIKFFKRAVQVDPDFVYSYTLLGHELVLTEELDKAADYFHAAVSRDPRHYNAWFGMGTIYSKQEKYELAELYYIKALKINPQNSVILVHIGAMQYFMQKKEQALQTLNTAAMLDPKNPLARFHRGSIYFSLGKHQEALRELEELKEVVPKESVVFYLIGKIHKTLGNVDSALMHFSWATDLDPKGANNQLRDAFDSAVVPMFSPARNDQSVDADQEPTSERSDDSTQAQQDINYDSDAY
ncbi:cell division cycle protein 27 homolog [Anastrepha ludens]|uniref:cell division cycle protein 27 homolog n=1 Tax=Anastrepha ludens TaxID=28586 RepID=UPI0023B151AB|nr:cell division cycle protein 27 homolog [Anastrepha ludens]